MSEKISKTDVDWKTSLTPEQFRILREKGTELPFSGEYVKTTDAGKYYCVACGNELFASESKFDAHCGWPSFDRTIQKESVEEIFDNTHGMTRTEITCSKCGGHLGHVFPDGPTETGKRYCINSVALTFKPEEK